MICVQNEEQFEKVINDISEQFQIADNLYLGEKYFSIKFNIAMMERVVLSKILTER